MIVNRRTVWSLLSILEFLENYLGAELLYDCDVDMIRINDWRKLALRFKAALKRLVKFGDEYWNINIKHLILLTKKK